jgi:general secretion pathway protein E
MDIEPFLVASSLIGIQAQRLVRVLCPQCKVLFEPNLEDLKKLEINLDDPYSVGREPAHIVYRTAWSKLKPIERLHPDKFLLYRAVGCDNCLGTGYRGRTGIYEMVMVTDSIRAHVLRNADSNTIKKVAKADGMVSLREDGIRKVVSGVTTIEEVVRATQIETD